MKSRYDANGNVVTKTDARNITTTYSPADSPIDALNRVTKMTYDAGGRLTQAADSITGAIARGYDGLDRLVAETTPQGNVSCSYDPAGRRTSMTVGGQQPVSYSYDNANRLTQIVQGASGVSFAYDSDGRRTSLTLPNGVTMMYSYDLASQLTGISYGALGNLTYSYDLAGRRTNVGGSFARTGMPNALTNASYNADNQLTQFGASNLTYDANGNLTSDGMNTYTWNARNQLASISGGVSANFQYDALGRRVTGDVDNRNVSYLYDALNPVEELSGATVTAATLSEPGPDKYFQRAGASGTSLYLTDALGSTVALISAAGALGTQYTYEPFGNATVTGAASANPFQFTGRENDATSLYFYRARYYSPIFQRFISEDPTGLQGGINVYAYVSDSPANFSDPTGLDKKPPCVKPNLVQKYFSIPIMKALSSATGWTLGNGIGASGAVPIGPSPRPGIGAAASQQLVVSPNGQAAIATNILIPAAATGGGGIAGVQVSISIIMPSLPWTSRVLLIRWVWEAATYMAVELIWRGQTACGNLPARPGSELAASVQPGDSR